MYGKIVIAKSVYREVTEKDDAASQMLRAAEAWIEIQAVDDESQYAMYHAKLHAGEVETMILAQQKPAADLVVLDDNAARKTAVFLGLTVTGTMGILVKAKQCGIIQSVKPLLDEIKRNGFYISAALYNSVLSAAGENT
jgi:predicted nucleic acid-binding protein